VIVIRLGDRNSAELFFDGCLRARRSTDCEEELRREAMAEMVEMVEMVENDASNLTKTVKCWLILQYCFTPPPDPIPWGTPKVPNPAWAGDHAAPTQDGADGGADFSIRSRWLQILLNARFWANDQAR
jgi:hypothetical protein